MALGICQFLPLSCRVCSSLETLGVKESVMLRSLKDSVSSKVTLLPKPVRLSNESQIPRVIAKFPLIRVFQAAGVTVTSLGQVATPHSPAHPRAILATPHSPSQAMLATPHSPHGSLCHGSLTLHAQWIRITAFPPWSTWSFPVQRNDKLQDRKSVV